MAKGGARSRSGPAPDPDALRRDRDGDGWVTLPAAGRKGAAPKWPLVAPKVVDAEGRARVQLSRQIAKRETELWKGLWRTPQAVRWQTNGQELEVALYVRSLVEAEQVGAPISLRTLIRQQQEALGLSLPGLARNRWRIGEVAAPAPKETSKGPSARERFTVVTGGRDGA